MFGNIDATRALIARMQPAQLKQFAMMHKDDIITMSLISEVQSKRNQAKLFQQAQQANAMPPKVNEQFVQSIPAQDSGIAGLPADNITYAAEGGIVGYSGADESEGQVVRSSFFPKESLLGRLSDWQDKYPGLPLAAMIADTPEYQALREEARKRGEQNRLQGGPVGSVFIPSGESGLRPDMSAAKAQTDSTRPGVVTRKVPPPARTAPSATTTKTPSAAPAEAPSAAPAEAPSYEELFRKAQTAAGVGKPVDPYAAERAKNAEILKAQNEEELADARARKEGLASLLKPREERIAQREAALEKQSETDKNMAIISAGLAIAQSTGKGISGIAEGATKGFAQYGEAMKLNKAERQKILEARDAYDEFKYNAENMSQKEITAAKGKIAAGAVAASEKIIQALMEEYKLNRADGTALFKAQFDDIQERKKEAASMARTQAEIAMREKLHNTPAAQRASTEENAIRDNMKQFGLSYADAYAKVKQVASGFKGEMTLDQATDNVKAFLESAQGSMYIREIQKKAKDAGQPVPDIYTIRNKLIEQEMGGSARQTVSNSPLLSAADKIVSGGK